MLVLKKQGWEGYYMSVVSSFVNVLFVPNDVNWMDFEILYSKGFFSDF